MRIPEAKDGPDGRFALYRNLIRTCEISRADRRARNQGLRQLYLTGAKDGSRPRYNAIKAYVRSSAALLYASGSTRFGVSLPPRYGDDFLDEEQAAREELRQVWHDSYAPLIFGLGVTWAHVWDTAVFKVFVSENRPHLMLLPEPGDLGLLHEDLIDWDTQEALCQWYTMDLARFARVVAAIPNAETRRRLMQQATDHAVPGTETALDVLPPAMNRIILASASPTMVGVVNTDAWGPMATPRVGDPVVRLAELWVKDDALGDYRVVTNFLPTEEILWDPPNPLNPGEHPFHNLSLELIPNYAWGSSPIDDQEALQAWREEKMTELDIRDGLQIDPPIVFEGMSTIDGEKAKAFRRRGGNITLSTPNAKATPMVPEPLPEPFSFVEQIDAMSAKAGGLPRGMTGQTEQGVRSGDQAMTQALLGAGPTFERAMLVVHCLEAVATAMLRLHRRVSDVTLQKTDGSKFLLSQMPADLVARVWAQSSSPLYAEKIVQKAMAAVQMKAITPEDALDYLDLPMTEALKAKARKLAQAQGEKGERVMEMKEAEAKAKLIKAQKP
jgi:hypothetical protein